MIGCAVDVADNDGTDGVDGVVDDVVDDVVADVIVAGL